MTTTIQSNLTKLTQPQLHLLSERVMDRFDDLAELLELDLCLHNKYYYGACPVHGGDKDNALNIFHTGDTYRGNWRCFTQQCEKYFKKSILGFIRGVLSRKRHDWTGPGDATVSFADTIQFVLDFLNEEVDNLKINNPQVDTQKFIHATQILNTKVQPNKKGQTRLQIRKRLQIPAQYYLDRGYTAEILNEYDVGLCNNEKTPMYQRVVVPIYDQEHQYMIGCTARSIFERCDKCKLWHNPKEDCPNEPTKHKYVKWLHSKGFKKEECLYNYWKAKEHIQKTKSAVLVESPGNVWRLEESGIYNSVAIFGTSFSDFQQILLDGLGVLSLVLIMDNDEAGKRATENIINQHRRLYHIHTVSITKNDLGEMNISDVKEQVLPTINDSIFR